MKLVVQPDGIVNSLDGSLWMTVPFDRWHLFPGSDIETFTLYIDQMLIAVLNIARLLSLTLNVEEVKDFVVER